jgi:hypothetical protein
LIPNLRHPALDEAHLLKAKVEAETVIDLFGRQMFEQAFEALNGGFDLGGLRVADL